MANKKNGLGSVYTPEGIVKLMLDYSNYESSQHIRKKHVMDNSCGDGRILCEVVRRYAAACTVDDPLALETASELSTYIHGIDVDEAACQSCIRNLDSVAAEFGISGVKWDIVCESAAVGDRYDGQMDYVFANPPYVRTKDQSGAIVDMYLMFYNIGFRMRKRDGVMCYLTPNSWNTSTCAAQMRDRIRRNRSLASVIDFGHTQLFNGVVVYAMMALFDGQYHSYIRYDGYDPSSGAFVANGCVRYDDAFVNGKLYFGTAEELDVISCVDGADKGVVSVKNGFQTSMDDIFVDNLPEGLSGYTIPIVKGSTGAWKTCLFPYTESLAPESLDVIKDKSPDVYEYIMSNEGSLRDRAYKSTAGPDAWYVFGRSQGLVDTFSHKVAVNSLLKGVDDIKVVDVPAGSAVYSGMYVLTSLTAEEISEIIKTDRFVTYVKSLRKYRNGGYYSFSSKDLERYINSVLAA